MRYQFKPISFENNVLGTLTLLIRIVTYGGMSYRDLDHVAGQVCSLLGSPNDRTSYQILQELPLQLTQFFQTCLHWNRKIGDIKYIAVPFFWLYFSNYNMKNYFEYSLRPRATRCHSRCHSGSRMSQWRYSSVPDVSFKTFWHFIFYIMVFSY